jgi:arabinan endo-1,5-alpha-L-arabinosidase
MFYGTWTHIALAKSKDGKTFARQLLPNGTSGMFGEGPGRNTRDPMIIRVGDHWNLYYAASDAPGGHGVIFARTSTDLLHWSEPTKVSFGGSAGDSPGSAECPWVYFDQASGFYYLLRNQIYGPHARFTVYRSKDPMDFGRNDDSHLVETMPYAAPEIIQSEGQLYLAVLLPGLDGIQLAKLKFAPRP